jgi:hypothetical protein
VRHTGAGGKALAVVRAILDRLRLQLHRLLAANVVGVMAVACSDRETGRTVAS